jgi:hypothetical protein
MLSSLLARARGDIDDRIAAVVFTKPEGDLRAMDVAKGPCIPVDGRKRPLVSPFEQDLGVTALHAAALLTVLTGEPSSGALEVVDRRRRSVLHLCTERLVNALVDADAEMTRLIDEDESAGQRRALPRFSAKREEYAGAWQVASKWPPKGRPMTNELLWTAKARDARAHGQPLYCWNGPSVPMIRIVSGTGLYPGRGA